MIRVEEIIERAAQQWPNKAAVIDRLQTTTYQELSSLACDIRDIVQRHATPGSIIGISLMDARDFLATLFGVVAARCIAIPISPVLPAAERERIIAETGVTWSIGTTGVKITVE